MRILLAVVLLLLLTPAPALAADGWASTWQGPGAATNDCRWPWTDCATRSITSKDTGLSITVTPTMYCECYVPGVQRPYRIIDLDPSQVRALGLDPSRGLWRVSVTYTDALPDTAMR